MKKALKIIGTAVKWYAIADMAACTIGYYGTLCERGIDYHKETGKEPTRRDIKTTMQEDVSFGLHMLNRTIRKHLKI